MNYHSISQITPQASCVTGSDSFCKLGYPPCAKRKTNSVTSKLIDGKSRLTNWILLVILNQHQVNHVLLFSQSEYFTEQQLQIIIIFLDRPLNKLRALKAKARSPLPLTLKIFPHRSQGALLLEGSYEI